MYASRSVDVVHFEWIIQATTFLEAIQVLDKPTIVSLRGAGIAVSPLVDQRIASRLPPLFRAVSRIHSISQDLVAAGRQFGVEDDKVVLIPPAIRLEDFVPPSTRNYSGRPFRVLTVAALRWKKNIMAGILAVKLLSDQGFDLAYDVIGEGNDREALTYAIHDLGLEGRVALLGHVSHTSVIEALKGAHAFLMPSVQEGFCNAVVEAQAMELPVIVTEAEGLRENIDPGVTGLVARKWSPEAIAEKIEFLLQHPEKCAEFGKAGRRRAETLFGINGQIERFEELYFTAIGEHTTRASQLPVRTMP